MSFKYLISQSSTVSSKNCERINPYIQMKEIEAMNALMTTSDPNRVAKILKELTFFKTQYSEILKNMQAKDCYKNLNKK